MSTDGTPTRQIAVFEPYLGQDTLGAVAQAFHERWLGMGAATREFEQALEAYLAVGDRSVVATNTGTSALHLGLLAAGAVRAWK